MQVVILLGVVCEHICVRYATTVSPACLRVHAYVHRGDHAYPVENACQYHNMISYSIWMQAHTLCCVRVIHVCVHIKSV